VKAQVEFIKWFLERKIISEIYLSAEHIKEVETQEFL